jgi:hypothetical protein
MDCLKNFRTRVEALEQQTKHLQQHPCTVGRRRWWWPSMAGGVVMLLGAIGIALGSVTPARADVIQCGDVLGPGGWFELEHDLECPIGRGVTVRDGAILDLQGHIVACPGDTRCIILMGSGTRLLNGAIEGGIAVSSDDCAISLDLDNSIEGDIVIGDDVAIDGAILTGCPGAGAPFPEPTTSPGGCTGANPPCSCSSDGVCTGSALCPSGQSCGRDASNTCVCS